MSMSTQEKAVESSTLDQEKFETANKQIKFAQVHQLSKYLEGRILTICDASIADKQQVKAMKDLVRDAIRTFRFHTEMIAHERGDEYSIGCPTLDIEETEEGFAFPVMLPDKA